MRRFTSYGPPRPDQDFMVERTALVQKVAAQLVGDPDAGGHYFTVFAPRQAGKTTTLRQVKAYIEQTHPERFWVGMDILHLVKDLKEALHRIFERRFGLALPPFESWEDVYRVLLKGGPLKRPVLLILDEFDGLPEDALADAIAFFRRCFHAREECLLHGVALIGVHAVLGKVERSASPFNVQRSVHIPNLTRAEVEDLFSQYQGESGQRIEPEVVERLWDLVRGQPGLTGWFGELLTEKYNPAQPPPWERKRPLEEGYPAITSAHVEQVIEAGLSYELNNNIRNLLSKSYEHQPFLRRLFVEHDIPFELYEAEQRWLHLNGVIIGVDSVQTGGKVCAFASPFVQRCLFSAFGRDLAEELNKWGLFTNEEGPLVGQYRETLDVEGLLRLYRSYLTRQAAKGEAPWSEQPVRSDARAFEAIGHFNLYAWLSHVLRGYVLTPEFPTGNGTADLVVRRRRTPQTAVLELKSFTEQREVAEGVEQVARYARKLGLSEAWLVMMADTSGYDWLRQQPPLWQEGGITVHLELIPWGWVAGKEGPSAQGTTGGAEATRSLAPSGFPASKGGPGENDAPKPRQKARRLVKRLTIEDRLELETVVVPLLTAGGLELIRTRLALPSPAMGAQEPALAWGQLLQALEKSRRLSELLTVLVFTYPELKTHGLIKKLQELFPRPGAGKS